MRQYVIGWIVCCLAMSCCQQSLGQIHFRTRGEVITLDSAAVVAIAHYRQLRRLQQVQEQHRQVADSVLQQSVVMLAACRAERQYWQRAYELEQKRKRSWRTVTAGSLGLLISLALLGLGA